MVKHLQNKKLRPLFLALLLGLSGMTSLFAQNINFIDNNVKALCVASATGWDTNGDGELSYAEAAAVTSIGTVFKGKNNIQSFNELEHFISLTAIDERAFMGCTVLAEITIPENIATIGDKAFVNCPALATVHFNAINCTSMSTSYNNENYSVFMSNQTTFPLTNLTIGSSVQNIPDYAFRGCNQIQNLTIPASVTKVGDYAFYECPAIETLTIGGDAIGNYAFTGCTNLETLTLVGGQIGEYAFYGCTNLTTLTIGEGVTSIGHCAFWNCPVLTTVHFNATNCTKMGELRDEGEEIYDPAYPIAFVWQPRHVFYCVFNSGTSNDCPSPIATLTIGDNVKRIPECAFLRSQGLTGSLTIPNAVTSIGRFAFKDCTGFTGNLILGNSVTTIGAGAFQGCSGFTGDLVIPSSVSTIGGETYIYDDFDCGHLVDHIYYEYGAFYGCEGFSGNLIIGNSVPYIGDHAFSNCSGFTGNLTIGNSVNYIGDHAFYSCSGFTGNLIIPNSVNLLEERSFAGCSNFDGALVIGRNVYTIGSGAFSGCSGFTVLISETSRPMSEGQEDPYNPGTFWIDPLFDGMNQNIPVYVPAGQISDYQNDEQWQWSYFTNYVEQVKFEQAGNNQWSDEFNWPTWEVPGSTDVVCIADNCQLDVDANVLFLYVLDNEDVLTINNGKTLTTTYGVDTRNASQLVVADGGQLIQSNTYLKATMQKHIDAYTSKDDGWNFIASPVTEGQSISGLIPTGETVYDLFYLDEENSYWKNYKVNTFDINNKQGYLYANSAGTTINFSGTMQPYVAEGVSIPLTKEGEGWNLVGNPFTFNAYANKPYYVINGRNVEAAASGAIAPCTGIIVKANGTENEAVTFTKDAPVTSSAQNHGNLQIALKEASTRSTSQIDKAIVSFNEGTTLPKFRFGDDAEIYLPLNGKDYAIVCTETTGEVPLYFKATKNSEYTLTVNPENVEMDYLHLIDNLTGNDIDLLATPSYTFTAKVNNYNSRFRLVFSANNNDLDNNDNFAFISNGQLVVAGEGTLQIIDILGHQLYAKQISTLTSNLTPLTSPGVYVLRLTNGKNVKTQKLIVK